MPNPMPLAAEKDMAHMHMILVYRGTGDSLAPCQAMHTSKFAGVRAPRVGLLVIGAVTRNISALPCTLCHCKRNTFVSQSKALLVRLKAASSAGILGLARSCRRVTPDIPKYATSSITVSPFKNQLLPDTACRHTWESQCYLQVE